MRYQYTSSGFKKSFSNNPLSIPEGVKLLLILNISIFILMELSGSSVSSQLQKANPIKSNNNLYLIIFKHIHHLFYQHHFICFYEFELPR